MSWAALIILTVALMFALVACVLIALKFFDASAAVAAQYETAHQRTLSTLEAIHEKNMRQLSEMADRFMSLDFSLFKAYQGSELAEEGGMDLPDEPVRVERPLGHGRHTVVGSLDEEALIALANERKLMAEDFPPGWDEQ